MTIGNRTSITITTLLLIIGLALAHAGACHAAPKGYLDYVADALVSLADGNAPESLACLKQATACNANDPLAHAVMGTALLFGGRVGDAQAEFALTSELGAQPEGDYGRGLIYLSKGDFGQAVTYLCQAQAAMPDVSMQGAIEYAKALGSGHYKIVDDYQGIESLQAIDAMAFMAQGKYAEAATIWQKLQAAAVRPTMGERIGCSMTFAKAGPVALTGWPVNSYKSEAATRGKLPVVSGKVTLNADLSKAGNIELVSFFVDNSFVGMTNHSPFQYSWDTTKVANGAHAVKIQGFANGAAVSEKSMQVMVRNAEPTAQAPRAGGDRAAKLWDELWRAMELRPSVAAINYNLALCRLQEGDTQAAETALERVMAADPDYLDAARRLSKLYEAESHYARLTKLPTSRKVVALTFDDGPKDFTGRLLDVLKDKGVKATFFVVGKQVEAYPDAIKRMVEEGHEVENHTYSHRALEFLSEREIVQEAFRTCAVVRSITGRRTQFLRPPGGREGKRLPDVMRKFGMSSVFWTGNMGNVEGTTREKLLNYALETAQPGAILLMHNVEIVTLLALPDIIDRLRAEGYEFVTMSEIVTQD